MRSQSRHLERIVFTYGSRAHIVYRVCRTYQTLRQRRLVPIRQMLFQSQDDAVGNDGSKNHPLKWSEEGQSRKKHLKPFTS